MKRILFAFAAAALMFVGCTKELEQRVDQLEQDVTELQSGLDALKAAVEKKLTVTDYNQTEDGYALHLSDGTTINIKNGADGAKGDKGDTGAQGPQGEKGETGPQGPQGEKGDKGDAFFQSVELSEDGAFIVITLVDGTVYELPLASNFNILFTLSETKVLAGETYKVPYQIVGAAESDEVVVRILSASNCEAVVVPAEKVVSVTPAQGAGYVDLYALNNTTGELKAKTISFNGEDVFEVGATTYYVSPVGGDVEVPVTTSVDYEIEIDGAWLAYAETKAVREETVVLSAAAANTSANDNVATVTMKNAEGKVLATFTVTQKNYYPEWVADEAGEPVEWAESFELYRYEDLSGDATAKTGVFTFELTDDPAKGAFKVVNMFNADLYYNNGQMVAGQGGVYYADVEGDVLTVYRSASVLSYGFTDDVTVAYNASEKTFAIADPVYAYNYGTSRDAYIANYAAAVKVDAPAGEGANIAGTWNQTVAGMSWPSPSATMTITVDGTAVTLTDFVAAGTVVTTTFENNQIVVPAGTMIGSGSNTAGPLDADVVLTLEGNTFTAAPFTVGGWINVTSYSATNPDMEVGGEEPEEPAAFAEKVWSIAVPFGGGQDRNLAMDSEYIYVAQSAGGNGVIKAYSIADGSYVKDVKVKTHTPAGLDNGTHAISCVRMLPNTDSSVNGGKDVLVASNLTTGDGTEKLIVYVWSNGVDADPDYFVIDSGVRRLGDKFTVKGTYQSGELHFFDFNDGNTVIRVNMKDGVAGLWGTPELAYATGRYAMPVAGASNIGECTIHPDTAFDGEGNPAAALLTTNATSGFFTQTSGNAYAVSTWTADPSLAQTFGYNFFSHNDKDYVAYVKVAGDRNSAALNVIEDVNGAADFKGTLEAKTGLFTAPVEGTGNAGHGVGDCATAVADGVRYIVVMGQNIGISLYKLN